MSKEDSQRVSRPATCAPATGWLRCLCEARRNRVAGRDSRCFRTRVRRTRPRVSYRRCCKVVRGRASKPGHSRSNCRRKSRRIPHDIVRTSSFPDAREYRGSPCWRTLATEAVKPQCPMYRETMLPLDSAERPSRRISTTPELVRRWR